MVILAYEDPEICSPMPSDFFNTEITSDTEHLEEDSALDRTAELCLSTLESVLQTPAVEKKPFPGDPNSLTRGSIPVDSVSPSESGECNFSRTPKSSRGKRPRKKTRKSQNGEGESVSPSQAIPEESFHGQHEQGIEIDVSHVIRNVSPRSKSMSTPSPPSIRQDPEHPIIHAPVATTRSYLPFSPPATAPTPGTLPVFSETSAFTPVKSSPSSSTKSQRPGNGLSNNVPLNSPLWGSLNSM